MQTEHLPDLLNLRDVQDVLKVGRSTVYKLVEDGRLKCIKIGKRVLVDRSDLAAFLDSLRQNDGAGEPS